MALELRKLTEEDARCICQWKYEAPYDGYNLPPWEIIKSRKMGIADSIIRDREFSAVYEKEELAGFIRLIIKADCIKAGLGLKPEFCGIGKGSELMECLKKKAAYLDSCLPIYLEVRSDNDRALRCYQKAGFLKTDQYKMDSPSGRHTYILMKYDTINEREYQEKNI